MNTRPVIFYDLPATTFRSEVPLIGDTVFTDGSVNIQTTIPKVIFCSYL